MFPTTLVFDTKQNNFYVFIMLSTPLEGFIFLNTEITIWSVHASHVAVVVTYNFFLLGTIAVILDRENTTTVWQLGQLVILLTKMRI